MIYTKLTNKAMKLAYQAHHGQTDYNGIPYILHPVHLAEEMDDEYSCCVALLHDVVEDTDVTIEALCKEFPREITDASRLMTHTEGTDYCDYVRAMKENPIAKKVKLADLEHNSDQSRCVGSNIPVERLRFWSEKYTTANQILTENSY